MQQGNDPPAGQPAPKRPGSLAAASHINAYPIPGYPIADALAMNCSYTIAIGVPLAALMLCGQSKQHTYTGVIVNANCFQAAEIINRNSRGYVPSGGTNAFTGSRHKPLDTGGMRKSILRHCQVNPGTTVFALLDDAGKFFKLDEMGNR